MRLNEEQIAELCWSLPYDVRMAILTMTVVQQNHKSTLKSVNGLLGLLVYMAKHLPDQERMEFAEVLRDVSDEVDVLKQLVN